MSQDARGLDRVHFDANAVIFRAGEPSDGAFVIESGSVEILVGPEHDMRRINLLGEGAMVGDIGLLDGKPRTATVRAVVPTTMIPIYREQLQGVLEKADPLIRYLVGVLLQRLRNASAAAAQAAGPAEPPALEAEPRHALHEQVMRALSLAHGLSEGVSKGQLELHYQPIVLLEGGELIGYEALVRWRHPTLGMVRPDEFIPLAEQTDLIFRIGEFVLERAIADWAVRGPLCDRTTDRHPFMSINLSAPEICRPGIVTTVQSALEAHGMDPRELRIELTETSLVGNKELVAQVMQRLLGLGVSLALDDFGKGFSGMDYLQSLPFSCLKIDKSFIDGVLDYDKSHHIVRSAIDLASTLRMSTVGEGVEDQPTVDALRGMGCLYGQGYFFGKPMPVQAVVEWADTRRSRNP